MAMLLLLLFHGKDPKLLALVDAQRVFYKEEGIN